MIDLMSSAIQSQVYILFIFIKMNFYLLWFLCDVSNEVH